MSTRKVVTGYKISDHYESGKLAIERRDSLGDYHGGVRAVEDVCSVEAYREFLQRYQAIHNDYITDKYWMTEDWE